MHNTAIQTITLKKEAGGHAGIFAEFLQGLGINGTVEGGKSMESSDKWTFAATTISFVPTTEYVKQSLLDMDVQKHIRDHECWLGTQNLYMVTGIKVASGASSAISQAEKKGFNFKVGFNLTPFGIPINVGPDIGAQNGLASAQSQVGADPFVFAYRLRRVRISKTQDPKHDDYNKGALLSLPDRENGKQVSVELEVGGVEDFDADPEDFELEVHETIDDLPNEEAQCKYAHSS